MVNRKRISSKSSNSKSVIRQVHSLTLKFACHQILKNETQVKELFDEQIVNHVNKEFNFQKYLKISRTDKKEFLNNILKSISGLLQAEIPIQCINVTV